MLFVYNFSNSPSLVTNKIVKTSAAPSSIFFCENVQSPEMLRTLRHKIDTLIQLSTSQNVNDDEKQKSVHL